ncbi:pathogen-associated molecular patterns-induced protein A70-like [Typha angustifolia]|uniref:pathogen-associated molecular patterns-induced protein A70-like n=1 Tax=Typha angustifolia TaxID=59011 RepID=UPI003C2F1C41
MLEESIPSILASVYGWFTPTVLFLLLNLVIGTIAITSKGGLRSSSSADSPECDRPAGLTRVPSLALDRLRSFNLYRFRSGEIPLAETLIQPPPQSREALEPSRIPDPLAAPVEPPKPAAEEASRDPQPHEQHIIRSQSDAHPTAGEKPVRLPARMKKSASDKSAFAHFDEEEAEAVAEVEVEVGSGGEVDARADDFINRFRNQLRLQRLDSIMRYKEMINRGGGH